MDHGRVGRPVVWTVKAAMGMAERFRRLVDKGETRRAGESRVPAYRAVTLGSDRDDWAVYNDRGDLVYRGGVMAAAMVANRLRADRD